MISILYHGPHWAPGGCWEKLDEEFRRLVVEQNPQDFWNWVLEAYSGKYRKDIDIATSMTSIYIDFENEIDAIVFKLKIGL